MDLPQDLFLHFIKAKLIYPLYSNFLEQFDAWDDVLLLNNFSVLIFRKN